MFAVAAAVVIGHLEWRPWGCREAGCGAGEEGHPQGGTTCAGQAMASLLVPLAFCNGPPQAGNVQFTRCLLSVPDRAWLYFGLESGAILRYAVPVRNGEEDSRVEGTLEMVMCGHRHRTVAIALVEQQSDQLLDPVPVLLSLDWGGEVALWRAEDGRCLLHNMRVIDGQALGMVVSTNGDYAVVYGVAQTINIVRVLTLEVIQTLPLPAGCWVRCAVVRAINITTVLVLLLTTAGALYFFLDQQAGCALDSPANTHIVPPTIRTIAAASVGRQLIICDASTCYAFDIAALLSPSPSPLPSGASGPLPTILWRASDGCAPIEKIMVTSAELILLLADGRLYTVSLASSGRSEPAAEPIRLPPIGRLSLRTVVLHNAPIDCVFESMTKLRMRPIFRKPCGASLAAAACDDEGSSPGTLSVTRMLLWDGPHDVTWEVQGHSDGTIARSVYSMLPSGHGDGSSIEAAIQMKSSLTAPIDVLALYERKGALLAAARDGAVESFDLLYGAFYIPLSHCEYSSTAHPVAALLMALPR